jgi:hypothetical protein
MHGSFDESGVSDGRTQRSWSIGFFALPVLIAVALVALAITQPSASNWISEAVQAEFAGTLAPDLAPTQLARPAMQIRTVRTD